MRFIYQVLLGFIIFDFMLVLFAPYFNTPGYNIGSVEDNSEIAKYENINNLGNMLIALIGNPITIMIILAIFVSGAIAKFLTGGSINTMLLIGICLFISTITILWNAASIALSNINPYKDSSITLFITAITVCIGILLMFSIIEMFTSQQGVDM